MIDNHHHDHDGHHAGRALGAAHGRGVTIALAILRLHLQPQLPVQHALPSNDAVVSSRTRRAAVREIDSESPSAGGDRERSELLA